MSGLRDLTQRIEAALGPDRTLDWEIHVAQGMEGVGSYGDHPRYTSSVDAAMSLVERQMPGWAVGIEPRYYHDPDVTRYRCILSAVDYARYTPYGDHVTRTEDVGKEATPALAICAALFRWLADERVAA